MKKKQISLFVLLFALAVSFAQTKKYTTYRVSDNETISSISRKLGVTPFDLLKLNPDAKEGINIDEVLIVPSDNFTVASSTTPKVTKINFFKQDSIKNGILYHKVKAYETIYSLSRKYKVSKRKVRKLNKLTRKSSISIGQVLKFPTKLADSETTNPAIVKTDTANKYITYTVQAQDTFYNLSRVYHASKETLIALNPQLKNGLKVNDQILIPINQSQTTTVEDVVVTADTESTPTYRTHLVLPKEGFFRLKQLYGFTKEEILAINPEITGGLKVGMEIKIPNSLQSEIALEDGNMAGKSLNVVMMLPFKAKNATNFQSDKFLNKVTDFYLGSVIALDELKSKGLSVNLKVLDTEKNTGNISTLLRSNDLSNTDVVIGPLVYGEFKEASRILKNKNIPLVSPISKKDHSSMGSKDIVQNKATDRDLENKTLNFIQNNYTNQKVIIITDNVTENTAKSQKTKANISRIKMYLKKQNSIKDILVLNMKDKFSIDRELFTNNINKNKETWVILASDEKNTVSAIMDNLSAFPTSFKITLFALKKPKILSRIENHKLNKVNFHFPVTSFVDQKSESVSAFNKNYKSKYGANPTDFSYRGYDTTYDALVRLANNKNKAFESGVSKRLQTKFNYSKQPRSGYRNQGIFIIRYENYNLIEVN